MLLMVSGCYSTYAQRYFVTSYSVADGLENAAVNDVIQDSSGLIWFATQSGISSFDGIQFTNFNSIDSLEVSGYQSLKLDSRGILWALPVLSVNRLSFFDQGKWKFIPRNTLLTESKNNISFDVAYINDKLIIANACNRNCLYIYSEDAWKKVCLPPKYQHLIITKVEFYHKKLYVGTSERIFILDDFIHFMFSESSIVIQRNIESFAFGSDERIWLVGDNWLGYYKNNIFIPVTMDLNLEKTISNEQVFIKVSPYDEVFTGNLTNFYVYTEFNKRIELLNKSKGLVNEGASSAYSDNEGNLWITSPRGISKISNRSIVTFKKSDGLYDNEIASAAEASSGKYIFGHHGWITIYQNGKFIRKELDKSLQSHFHDKRVLDLISDKKGNFWAVVPSRGIAFISQDMSMKWFGVESGIKGRAVSVGVLNNGKVICATSTGLFQKSGDRFIPLRNFQKEGILIRKIFPGNDSSYFLSTINNGLIEVKGNIFKNYKTDDDKNGNNVYCILTDSNHDPLVGTLDGLYRISNNKLKKVKEPGLTINNPVYLIIEDKRQRLWFGTNNGIFRWDKKSLAHFTVSNGLSGQDINRSAGILDENNYLWFGTNNGITIFRPEYEQSLSNVSPPRVSVVSISAKAKTYKNVREVQLGNYNGDITISFRILSYTDKNQIYYKYKLEGLTDSWSKPLLYTSKEIHIGNLPPGKYQFCIMACNLYGIWSEPVTSAIINIDNPYWKKWWFVIICVILAAAGFYMTHEFLYITRSKRKLEKLVAIRTKELTLSEDRLKNMNQSKDTFFSIISHDLRSPYNSLLGMLDMLIQEYSHYSDEQKLDFLTKIKESADKSYNLLENLLTWSKLQRGYITLQPEWFDVDELIEGSLATLSSSASAKKITFEVNSSQKIQAFADRNMISTIIRNFLSNAIKYSFPDSIIELSFYSNSPGYITFSVKDEGKGLSEKQISNLFKIDHFVSTRGTLNEGGSGMGLILCKEFIEMHNGKIWLESTVNKGSTFYFSIPLEYIER